MPLALLFPPSHGCSPCLYLYRLRQAVSGSNRSSISYHVNADEAYSMYDGAPNAEFDVRICRLQVMMGGQAGKSAEACWQS